MSPRLDLDAMDALARGALRALGAVGAGIARALDEVEHWARQPEVWPAVAHWKRGVVQDDRDSPIHFTPSRPADVPPPAPLGPGVARDAEALATLFYWVWDHVGPSGVEAVRARARWTWARVFARPAVARCPLDGEEVIGNYDDASCPMCAVVAGHSDHGDTRIQNGVELGNYLALSIRVGRPLHVVPCLDERAGVISVAAEFSWLNAPGNSESWSGAIATARATSRPDERADPRWPEALAERLRVDMWEQRQVRKVIRDFELGRRRVVTPAG